MDSKDKIKEETIQEVLGLIDEMKMKYGKSDIYGLLDILIDKIMRL